MSNKPNNTIYKTIDPRWELYYELMAWYEKASKHGAKPATRYHLLAEVNHQLNSCPIPEPETIYVDRVWAQKPTTSHSKPNPFRK